MGATAALAGWLAGYRVRGKTTEGKWQREWSGGGSLFVLVRQPDSQADVDD